MIGSRGERTGNENTPENGLVIKKHYMEDRNHRSSVWTNEDKDVQKRAFNASPSDKLRTWQHHFITSFNKGKVKDPEERCVLKMSAPSCKTHACIIKSLRHLEQTIYMKLKSEGQSSNALLSNVPGINVCNYNC